MLARASSTFPVTSQPADASLQVCVATIRGGISACVSVSLGQDLSCDRSPRPLVLLNSAPHPGAISEIGEADKIGQPLVLISASDTAPHINRKLGSPAEIRVPVQLQEWAEYYQQQGSSEEEIQAWVDGYLAVPDAAPDLSQGGDGAAGSSASPLEAMAKEEWTAPSVPHDGNDGGTAAGLASSAPGPASAGSNQDRIGTPGADAVEESRPVGGRQQSPADEPSHAQNEAASLADQGGVSFDMCTHRGLHILG